jgi:hypothetical protein
MELPLKPNNKAAAALAAANCLQGKLRIYTPGGLWNLEGQ